MSSIVFETGTLPRGMAGANAPLARFIQLVPGRRPPRRADRSVGGILPVRALRYCEPISAASAFGWLIFLPMRFRLLFDGSETFYHYEGLDDFLPLRSVVYPGFCERFDAAAPEAIKGYAPAFLAGSPQAGVLQVWPGSMVRTAPGWSLLIRPVVNLPRPSGFEIFEGIIETDTWFGPLFTNIRLTRTNIPIEFDDDVPFMQVQPVRKAHYDDGLLSQFVVDDDVGRLSGDDWLAYQETVLKPSQAPRRRLGHYAAGVRKAAAHRRTEAAS
ncbi:MAG: DUF6065 family protein [Hyphomicrobiaceae bacterium]